ncbi:hypothetical protein BFV94_3165 [Alteromonas macleodii]|nr:hypothetical protein BFV93_3155 [Alteromonas macleodii]OES28964.1 hypothetical protein BFV94_3165 [Alteromonas macleodii]OES40103.1 hypothetical protein BFV96_3148 [Alteromonas macleodii]
MLDFKLSGWHKDRCKNAQQRSTGLGVNCSLIRRQASVFSKSYSIYYSYPQ